MALLVNNEYIDDSQIRGEAETVRRQLLEENPGEDELALRMRAWEYARENVIGRTLLKQVALAATGRTAAHEVEANLAIEQFVEQMTAGVPHPSSREIAEHYKKYREELRHPELVHASHIVKNIDETADEATARAGIEEAARALEQGMPFAEAADRFSDCPGRGGDLGFFIHGQMVKEFDAVIFELRMGEVSGIFRTPFGFHIAKLNQKIPEGIWPLQEVRSKLATAIVETRKNVIIAQFVAALRESAKIKRVSSQDEARV